jgi:CheY-like chemotaxis protein
LVVEGDVLVRATVSDYIRECGCKVYEASGAAEALEILRAGHKVDVLLSDAGSNGSSDGFALAQQFVRSSRQ